MRNSNDCRFGIVNQFAQFDKPGLIIVGDFGRIDKLGSDRIGDFDKPDNLDNGYADDYQLDDISDSVLDFADSAEQYRLGHYSQQYIPAERGGVVDFRSYFCAQHSEFE